jgi:hypothetical protein
MKRECDECGGEGCVTETVSGGRFDSRAEQWYPEEETRVCPECHGEKTLEHPQHANLFNTTPHQQRKLKREHTRGQRNTVVLAMLRAT